jgi:integrase
MRGDPVTSRQLPAASVAGSDRLLTVHDLAAYLDVPVKTIYAWRHLSTGSRGISKGAHPEAIKRHLGHSSIVVTMDVYGHLFSSEAETLAAALDDLYAQNRTDCQVSVPARQVGSGTYTTLGDGL